MSSNLMQKVGFVVAALRQVVALVHLVLGLEPALTTLPFLLVARALPDSLQLAWPDFFQKI